MKSVFIILLLLINCSFAAADSASLKSLWHYNCHIMDDTSADALFSEGGINAPNAETAVAIFVERLRKYRDQGENKFLLNILRSRPAKEIRCDRAGSADFNPAFN